MDTLDEGTKGRRDEGTIHVLGSREWDDGARFHRATQDGEQVKTHELFISGIFRLLL